MSNNIKPLNSVVGFVYQNIDRFIMIGLNALWYLGDLKIEELTV